MIDAGSFIPVNRAPTDDAPALRAALAAAAGGALYLPAGTYRLGSLVVYDCRTMGSIRIVGDGAGTQLTGVGGAAGCLHILGRMGAGADHVAIEGVRFVAATTGAMATALHLEGVAVYSLRDVYCNGNGRLQTAILLTGTQQGEIAGGHLYKCADGIVLRKLASGIASNGADIHGVSGMCDARNVVVDGSDSLFLRSNHFVQAPVGVDVVNGGFGMLNIEGNHFESHTDTAVRFNGTMARIAGNVFFTGQGGTDIRLLDGDGSVIESNMLTGSLSIAAGVTKTSVRDNVSAVGGTRTDLGTGTVYTGNRNVGMGSLF